MVIDLVRVQATDDDYRFALAQAEQGDAADDIVDALVSRGLDGGASERLTRRVQRHRAEDHRKAATRTLAIGFTWLVAGVALTIFGEHNAALHGSGTYRVFWGAIVIGGLQFLEGVRKLVFCGPRDPNAEPRANFLERGVGRGMLLGMAGGTIVGGVSGYAVSSHPGAVGRHFRRGATRPDPRLGRGGTPRGVIRRGRPLPRPELTGPSLPRRQGQDVRQERRAFDGQEALRVELHAGIRLRRSRNPGERRSVRPPVRPGMRVTTPCERGNFAPGDRSPFQVGPAG